MFLFLETLLACEGVMELRSSTLFDNTILYKTNAKMYISCLIIYFVNKQKIKITRLNWLMFQKWKIYVKIASLYQIIYDRRHIPPLTLQYLCYW